jgi:hypothetical protein
MNETTKLGEIGAKLDAILAALNELLVWAPRPTAAWYRAQTQAGPVTSHVHSFPRGTNAPKLLRHRVSYDSRHPHQTRSWASWNIRLRQMGPKSTFPQNKQCMSLATFLDPYPLILARMRPGEFPDRPEALNGSKYRFSKADLKADVAT